MGKGADSRLPQSQEPTMQVKTDQELTHNALDAHTQENVELIIQPDQHGLTVELPNGHIVVLDVSKGELDIYH